MSPETPAPETPDVPEAPATPEAPAIAVAADKVRTPEAAAERLKALFPALFGGAAKPIKLKIQADIEARAPGVFPKPVLTAFLRRYTAGNAYLRALVREPQRLDLDGQPAGEIAEEHREAAKKALAERRERQQAREQEMLAARRWRLDLLADWQRTSLSRANFCALKGVDEGALDALLAQAKEELAAQPPAPPRRPAPGRSGQRPEGRPQERRGPRPERGPRPPKA